MPRLLAPNSASMESHEVVRKRTYQVRTLNDILAVIEGLNREKAIGALSLNLGPGGTAQTMVFEERKQVRGGPAVI